MRTPKQPANDSAYFELPQALQAHQCLKLAHLGVRPYVHALRFAAYGEVAQVEKLLLQRCVPERQHASLAGVEYLGRVKGEHRHVAVTRDAAPVQLDAEGVRRIVDHPEAVLFGVVLYTTFVTEGGNGARYAVILACALFALARLFLKRDEESV